MAYTVLVPGARPEGGRIAAAKVRDPVGVAFLQLVPFYGLYWWYTINAELRSFGRAREDQELASSRPGLSLLALFPGSFLFIPLLVTAFGTASRIRRAEGLVEAEKRTNVWLMLGLYLVGSVLVIPIVFAAGYMQSHLNSIWRPHSNSWALATGEAAAFVGGREEVIPLCALCTGKLLVGEANLEADVEVHRDEAPGNCDLCEKPLPASVALPPAASE